MLRPGYHDDSEYSNEEVSEQENISDTDELRSLSFGSLVKAQDDLQKEETDVDIKDHGRRNREKSSKINHKTRKSKHAPSEVSSKRPVSVIRDSIASSSRSSTLHGDIRFDPAYGKADLHQTRQNYAFLNEYREKELNDMKQELKKTHNNGEKAKLEAAIRSLSGRLKTLKDRDFEHKILQKAKKENRFMTRKAKREFVLKEKFKTMKKKDIDRVIERRRKKMSSKEKKTMPERRT